jgi:hypothetical protein
LFPLLVSDVRVPAISDKKEAMDKVVWERLVHAICMVESGCDDSARNPKSSASGRFQMLKIYVDEVNRIKGKRTYSYNDRFDPLKAREMFEIYQQYYNPNKDIDTAITFLIKFPFLQIHVTYGKRSKEVQCCLCPFSSPVSLRVIVCVKRK